MISVLIAVMAMLAAPEPLLQNSRSEAQRAFSSCAHEVAQEAGASGYTGSDIADEIRSRCRYEAQNYRAVVISQYVSMGWRRVDAEEEASSLVEHVVENAVASVDYSDE